MAEKQSLVLREKERVKKRMKKIERKSKKANPPPPIISMILLCEDVCMHLVWCGGFSLGYVNVVITLSVCLTVTSGTNTVNVISHHLYLCHNTQPKAEDAGASAPVLPHLSVTLEFHLKKKKSKQRKTNHVFPTLFKLGDQSGEN